MTKELYLSKNIHGLNFKWINNLFLWLKTQLFVLLHNILDIQKVNVANE